MRGAVVESRPRRAGELRRVIRAMRIASADRNDRTADLKEVEQARLELLAEALDGVTADMPPDHDQLLLGILPGETPRYWVDATSFVFMGRDNRDYIFAKDTRRGRTILSQNSDVEAIADAVMRYVAERMVEREQTIEGDWLTKKVESRRLSSLSEVKLIWAVAGFGVGIVAGMILIVGFAWLTVG